MMTETSDNILDALKTASSGKCRIIIVISIIIIAIIT
jgi:hypothetical protein